MLRAETLEELIDAAALLSTQPLPRGRRVAILTNAGGLGILCSDACEAAGLELSELSRGDDDAARRASARRGEPREPDRHARLGDRGQLRGGAAARARRSGRRLGDRPLRPAGHGRRRGRRGRASSGRWKACPRTSPCSRRCSAPRGSRRRSARRSGAGRALHVPRVGGAGPRARRRARRMAAPARGHRPAGRRDRRGRRRADRLDRPTTAGSRPPRRESC